MWTSELHDTLRRASGLGAGSTCLDRVPRPHPAHRHLSRNICDTTQTGPGAKSVDRGDEGKTSSARDDCATQRRCTKRGSEGIEWRLYIPVVVPRGCPGLKILSTFWRSLRSNQSQKLSIRSSAWNITNKDSDDLGISGTCDCITEPYLIYIYSI